MNPLSFNFITNHEINSISTSELKKTSKGEAQKKFWGLDDRFWMQIIDKEFHQHGPLVFDKGLHRGDTEPGFLQSLKEGCEFASEHLTEKLDLSFYLNLHKKLCAHFEGINTKTMMQAAETGRFKQGGRTYAGSSLKFDPQAREHYIIRELYNRCYIGHENLLRKSWWTLNIIKLFNEYSMSNSKQHDWAEQQKQLLTSMPEVWNYITSQYADSKSFIAKFEAEEESRIQRINEYIASICEVLQMPKFTELSIKSHLIKTDYIVLKESEFMEIVEALFDRYNAQVQKINEQIKQCVCSNTLEKLKKDKLIAIAELYQLLEWLHPFKDGQGRTDLTLLAKLLSEEGYNPAILEKPYFSTLATLPEWTEHLIQGVENWKEEARIS